MTVDRKYFRAEGRTLAECERFHHEWRTCEAAAAVLREQIGATKCQLAYSSESSQVVYAQFADGTAPKGWRPIAKDPGWYRPPRDPKTRATLALPPLPDWDIFTCRLFPELQFPGWVSRGSRPGSSTLSNASFEKFGDVFVVSLPASAEQVPPDAVPLKASEYWQLREAHAATVAA